MITPNLLAQVSESIDRTKTFLVAGDKLKRIEEHLRFHGRIATASGNAEFCRL
jgi:DNA-binding GntR family transcriptional regulator